MQIPPPLPNIRITPHLLFFPLRQVLQSGVRSFHLCKKSCPSHQPQQANQLKFMDFYIWHHSCSTIAAIRRTSTKDPIIENEVAAAHLEMSLEDRESSGAHCGVLIRGIYEGYRKFLLEYFLRRLSCAPMARKGDSGT